MNYCYNFDNNINNAFIYYNGYQPNFQQYQQFVNNLYYQQMLQGQGQMQTYISNHIQPQTPLIPQTPQIQQLSDVQPSLAEVQPPLPPERKHTVCIKGMGCKNIRCTDYHHPSKDLDILNASKK